MDSTFNRLAKWLVGMLVVSLLVVGYVVVSGATHTASKVDLQTNAQNAVISEAMGQDAR